MDVNQMFPWFSTHSDREGSLIAGKNSDELRECIEKSYVVVTYSV